MPAIIASAPGKAILLGEHAVVYGCPAIAIPVTQVKARVIIQPGINQPPGWFRIESQAIDLNAMLDELPATNPLCILVERVREELGISRFPSLTMTIKSTIPPAAGLGSGAAVSVAVIRALSAFCAKPLADEIVNNIAFAIEKLYHGTPSGIDNTVITYNCPVYFQREYPLELLRIKESLTLVIADTGIKSSTKETVGDVRDHYNQNPSLYKSIFDQIRQIVLDARIFLENGECSHLGRLMNQNHTLLQEIGVSSPELDHLVDVANKAGALGAKMSGGGRGGNMIALAQPGSEKALAQALLEEGGAKRAFLSRIQPTGD